MRNVNLLSWVCIQAVKEGVGCLDLALLGEGIFLLSSRLCKKKKKKSYARLVEYLSSYARCLGFGYRGEPWTLALMLHAE